MNINDDFLDPLKDMLSKIAQKNLFSDIGKGLNILFNTDPQIKVEEAPKVTVITLDTSDPNAVKTTIELDGKIVYDNIVRDLKMTNTQFEVTDYTDEEIAQAFGEDRMKEFKNRDFDSELAQALDDEDYELAAKIRDEHKAWETKYNKRERNLKEEKEENNQEEDTN